MYIGFRVKYPLLLSCFNESGIFATDFRKKNTQISNFMKIRPVGAELFHVDRQTDMTNLRVAFRNFVLMKLEFSRQIFEKKPLKCQIS